MGGVALLTLLGMLSLCIYLLFERRSMLMSAKQMLLLCLIMLLQVGWALLMRLANGYLIPVSLGLLLVALLMDASLAVFVNVILSLLTALYAPTVNGMFSIALMSILCGPAIVLLFSQEVAAHDDAAGRRDHRRGQLPGDDFLRPVHERGRWTACSSTPCGRPPAAPRARSSASPSSRCWSGCSILRRRRSSSSCPIRTSRCCGGCCSRLRAPITTPSSSRISPRRVHSHRRKRPACPRRRVLSRHRQAQAPDVLQGEPDGDNPHDPDRSARLHCDPHRAYARWRADGAEGAHS